MPCGRCSSSVGRGATEYRESVALAAVLCHSGPAGTNSNRFCRSGTWRWHHDTTILKGSTDAAHRTQTVTFLAACNRGINGQVAISALDPGCACSLRLSLETVDIFRIQRIQVH